MNKILALSLSVTIMICTLSSSDKSIPNNNLEYLDHIVYMDNNNVYPRRNIKQTTGSSTGKSLVLNNDNTAYVLNKSSFSKLEKQNTSKYLKNGGIIAVTDNNVTSEFLKEKIDTNVMDFDYSLNNSQKGFYVYNNGVTNVTINVSVGLLGIEKDEDNDGIFTKTHEPSITDFSIDKSVLVNSIIDSVRKNKYRFDENGNFLINHIVDEGGGSTIVNTDTSGEIIAYAFLENYLFLESDNTKYLCSYTIGTSVVDVMKIKDSNSKIHGVYDVASTYTVDAEPNYAVTDYKVRMKSTSQIIDSSYLNSNTSTSVSLGGSIGFQGDNITGSINGGVSYTYSPDSQNIINDLAAGNTKYWSSDVVDEQFGASKKLTPAIRILNSNDNSQTEEFSRVESFKIKDNVWWIFARRYYMMDAYRKELKISFESDGNFTQKTIVG